MPNRIRHAVVSLLTLAVSVHYRALMSLLYCRDYRLPTIHLNMAALLLQICLVINKSLWKWKQPDLISCSLLKLALWLLLQENTKYRDIKVSSYIVCDSILYLIKLSRITGLYAQFVLVFAHIHTVNAGFNNYLTFCNITVTCKLCLVHVYRAQQTGMRPVCYNYRYRCRHAQYEVEVAGDKRKRVNVINSRSRKLQFKNFVSMASTDPLWVVHTQTYPSAYPH